MFILKTAILNEQNNHVPLQVEHMGANYRWDDADSVTRMVTGPLAVEPNMTAFHLDPLTRPTDLIRQGYIHALGLLTSAAFHETLGGLRVQPHEWYPADVVYNGEWLHYWWLHMTQGFEERIDYVRSSFEVRKPGGARERIPIGNHAALRRACLELVDTIDGGELLPRAIRFESGTPTYDLLALRLTNHTWVVSDRLAARLRERRLTGFELLPSDVEFESAL
jgi:hypothetical protein